MPEPCIKLRTNFHRTNIIIILLIILSATMLSAETFTVRYDFQRPEISDIRIGDAVYQEILMPNSPAGGLPGQPALPAHGAYILIPYSSEIESVELIRSEQISLGSKYNIRPVGEPYPLSASSDQIKLPEPNPEIYASDEIFPAVKYENIGTQSLRGYDILVLKLNPVEYIPKTGELFYYENIEVVVKTAPAVKSGSLFRGYQEDAEIITSRVDNPEMLSRYASADKAGSKSYDLLILTAPAYETVFQTLKDYHDTTGILTEIRTTDDVGSNDPTAVRQYIADRYLNDGIQFVIIGGDDELLPAVDLYVKSSDGGSYEDFDMPADLYFGCLDGTYNYDGDSYWGEPTDGESGGDVDMMAEVYVGRFSASDPFQMANIINKTIAYLESEDAYLNNVAMIGENLTFGGLGEYGGYSLDQIIDHSDGDGYTTQGIPSSVYDIEKIYDMDWTNNNWTVGELASRVNSGIHIINHYGHCNTDFALKMISMNIISFWSNTNYFFLYSQGCYAGSFDIGDCWAEVCHSTVPFGAFALVMNARYGWGDYGTDGPSQRYDREFFDAVYNDSENKKQIGAANQDSKEDNLYRINEGCMRWCTYQLNVFGDPTVELKSWGGLTFDYPSGIPTEIEPDESVSFDLVVSGVCGGIPVENSAQFHYSISGSEEQIAALTQTGANHYQVDLPLLSCGDILTFYFTAEESTRGIFFDTDIMEPHTVYPCEQTTTLFEDDFETDKGWSVSNNNWQRGVPQGQGGYDLQYGVPDPSSGYDGSNVYGYNLDGDYANNLPELYLTSPAIDCSSAERVYLKYRRWLGVEGPLNDHARIDISNDGSSWNTIWQNTRIIADNFWTEHNIDVTEYAAGEGNIYFRWVMGPTNYTKRYCGWNIDAVEVYGFDCDPYICGDATSDEKVNVSDAVFIINYVFSSGNPPDPLEAGDVNCDENVNVSDAVYIINYVFSSGKTPCDTNGDTIPDC